MPVSELQAPISKEAPAVTIDDALARFLVQLEADGRSPHTIVAAWWRDVGPGGRHPTLRRRKRRTPPEKSQNTRLDDISSSLTL